MRQPSWRSAGDMPFIDWPSTRYLAYGLAQNKIEGGLTCSYSPAVPRCSIGDGVDDDRRNGLDPQIVAPPAWPFDEERADRSGAMDTFEDRPMSAYFLVKWVHVLSSVALVGTGFGSAYFMFFANRSANAEAQAVVARLVVRADWWFTTPAGILQPTTGLVLTHMLGTAVVDAVDCRRARVIPDRRRLLVTRRVAPDPDGPHGQRGGSVPFSLA